VKCRSGGFRAKRAFSGKDSWQRGFATGRSLGRFQTGGTILPRCTAITRNTTLAVALTQMAMIEPYTPALPPVSHSGPMGVASPQSPASIGRIPGTDTLVWSGTTLPTGPWATAGRGPR
jgi:hypothetical protein